MEKNSTSKRSLKLCRQSANKYEATSRGSRPGSSVATGSKNAEALRSENVDAENVLSCEILPKEKCGIQTKCVESEQTGEVNSLASVKLVPADEIADIFPPDGREVAVVVSWNWDSSQRKSSPKPEKSKSTTPGGQKKRSSKICSPLMRGQPPARRKRLLKKDSTSTKSSFVSELRALSEKLQKAKELVQTTEDTESEENVLCFELSGSNTEEFHFRQNDPAFVLDNLEKIKNDSFRTLLEDVDDDCLIQCSQEVEKTLQACESPLKKYPKFNKLGAVKLDKNSPNRAKTPSKGRAHYTTPRRSPRIRSQNPVGSHTGQPKSNTSSQKADELLDEDLVESLLDDEIELLSQIPSPSVILNREKDKQHAVANNSTSVNVPMLLKNKTQQMLSKQSDQGSLNGIVNLATSSSCVTLVRNCLTTEGTLKLATSSADKNCSSVNNNYSMPKDIVGVNKLVKDSNTNRCQANQAGVKERIKPIYDSYGDPAVCTFQDLVESSVLSCSPVGPSSPLRNGESTSMQQQQQIQCSPPLQCTPEEIEKKKNEALERRRRKNRSCQQSSLNSKNVQSIQHHFPQENKVKILPQVPTSPSRRYTPEEIEKKRLEALQIKRQQSLLWTSNSSSRSRQRVLKKCL